MNFMLTRADSATHVRIVALALTLSILIAWIAIAVR
jgi:hypothetical protein